MFSCRLKRHNLSRIDLGTAECYSDMVFRGSAVMTQLGVFNLLDIVTVISMIKVEGFVVAMAAADFSVCAETDKISVILPPSEFNLMISVSGLLNIIFCPGLGHRYLENRFRLCRAQHQDYIVGPEDGRRCSCRLCHEEITNKENVIFIKNYFFSPYGVLGFWGS